MKKTSNVFGILFCLLIAACTVSKGRFDRIELPKGTTAETAQKIVGVILQDGFWEKMSKKFTHFDPSKHKIYLEIHLTGLLGEKETYAYSSRPEDDVPPTHRGGSPGEAYLIIGINYQGKLDNAGEIVQYGKAMIEESIDPLLLAFEAEKLLQAGEFDQAVVKLSKALELKSDLVVAHHFLGFAHLSKGLYDQAISDCNKVIELNPKFAMAYNNRGFAYLNKGQYDQALSDYNKAIELDPKNAMAYSNRGIAYYYKGEHDKAWEDVHKIQSLGYQVNPEFLKALREASGRQK